MRNNTPNTEFKKNMLLLAPQGPNMGAEGMVTRKFVSMLKNNGWRVIWIFQPSCHDYPAELIHDSDLIAIETNKYKNSKPKSLGLPITTSNTLLNNFKWCIKAYLRSSQIIREGHIDLISSRIMPKFGHLPALLLRRRYRLPWHVNWSDPLPHYMAPSPYGLGENVKPNIVDSKYLSSICKNASFHTFPSERLRQYYLRYIPVSLERSFVIPHIINNSLPNHVHSEDKLIITHVGGGLLHRDPTLFFQALSDIKPSLKFHGINAEVRFVGPVEDKIKTACIKQGVDDLVSFFGPVSYEQSLDVIKSSTINLVLEAPMSEGIFLPSKITDIIGCGKPIFAVSPKRGVLHDLLTKYAGGLFTDCLDKNNIKLGLETLIHDWHANKLSSHQYKVDALYNLFSSDNVWKSFSKILNTYLYS